ncbi:MAG: peptide ABC transporter substrate-binding protein [Christensenellaceae bacterium]|jgi:oligopeptide transport system substrate-binding protein|nr:peptide ABC transporter substrate-binding protein [Christensenellaceae bacterium]
MKKLVALVLSLLLATSLLAGCASPSPTPDAGGEATAAPTQGQSAEPTATDAPPADGGKSIVINLGQEPPEMNTILTTSTGSMNVLRHIVDGLTILDQNDNPIPGVAESWDYDAETLTYTFHLRQGAAWNDGSPVTAKDFVFAWDTFFTPETGAEYAGTWASLFLGASEKLNAAELSAENKALLTALGYEGNVGWKAIDESTLQVTMAFPCQYFLSVLAFPSTMPVPQAGYETIGATAYGTEKENIMTNGAYTIADWVHESYMVLKKNPSYWDAANIDVEEIRIEMISDTNTAYNAFVSGEIDMIGLNAEQSAQLTSEGKEVLHYDDGSAWYFEYNTAQKGLNNKKVRKALTLAVDAELFISTVIKNSSTAAYSFVPPAIQGGSFAEKVGKLYERIPTDGDYSAVKALFEEGLAEEGMTAADLKFVIITDEGDTAAKNCAFFQEQWKTHLGLDVEIQQMTYQNRLERMTNKDFSVVMAGWGPDYNDPMTFLDLFVSGSGNNHTSYANTEYDALVAQALFESDAAKRDEMLIAIEKIIAEDMPIGPIYNRRRDYITSDRLTGVVRTAFDDMNFRWAKVA